MIFAVELYVVLLIYILSLHFPHVCVLFLLSDEIPDPFLIVSWYFDRLRPYGFGRILETIVQTANNR